MNASLFLLAQAPKFGQKGPPANPEEMWAFLAAYLGVVIGIVLCTLVIFLVIFYFFSKTMATALSKCSESNRLMQPGMAYLMMIPCFQIIWWYFVAINVPGSLKKEFEDRGRDDGSDYGKMFGLVAAILVSVNTVVSCIPYVNLCGGLFAIVYLVFFILFWVKIAGYSSQLGRD